MRSQRLAGRAIFVGMLETVGVDQQAMRPEESRIAEVAGENIVEARAAPLGPAVDHPAAAAAALNQTMLIKKRPCRKPCAGLNPAEPLVRDLAAEAARAGTGHQRVGRLVEELDRGVEQAP